jgi:hypothetical protein
MSWFKTDSRLIDRDRELLLRAQALAGEPELDAFLEALRDEQSYRLASRKKVLDFLQFFEAPERRFEQRRLQQRLGVLLAVLRDLKVFTAIHFLVFPRNQSERFCLHPDYFVLEADAGSLEEHAFYLQAEADLKALVVRGTEAAAAFWRAVHKTLKF